MGENIVILGCGYIGVNLANYLICKSHKVTIIGRKSFYTKTLHSQINFLERDINDDFRLSEYIPKDSIIIYALGSINANNKFADIENDIKKSYFLFIKLLNCLEKQEIKRFIFLSSAGTVYGDAEVDFIDESHCLNPINIYGLQKSYFEQLIKIKHIESSYPDYLIFRISNPYGGVSIPNSNQGIIPTLLDKTQTNGAFEAWASLDTIRDYIYIDELCEFVCRAIDRNIENGIYNLGSGVGHSIREIIQAFEATTSTKVKIEEKQILKGIVKRNVLNVTKLKKATQFEPEIALDSGLMKYIEVMKSFL